MSKKKRTEDEDFLGFLKADTVEENIGQVIGVIAFLVFYTGAFLLLIV